MLDCICFFVFACSFTQRKGGWLKGTPSRYVHMHMHQCVCICIG